MSASPDPVLLDVSAEGVAVVTLNRPEKRNAFDELMIGGLREIFETLKGADHVRAVFLRGAGESFCAGADLDWMQRAATYTQEDNETDALLLARMLQHLHDLPQLTVALVHGAAMGGGAGLVAACDVGVALKDTKFQFSEVRLGLTPATISPSWWRRSGRAGPRRCSPRGKGSTPPSPSALGLCNTRSTPPKNCKR